MNIKRLGEIQERKDAIRQELEQATEERVKELEQEVDTLNQEETELRGRLRLADKLGEPERKPVDGCPDERTQRGRDLKEKRSVTIGSGQLIKPTEHQKTVNGEVGGSISSIVDLVKVTSCYGMSEYQVPYQTGEMTAGKTAEGAKATSSDPTFSYVSIKPVTLTTYSEVSREAQKLTDVDYYSLVLAAARKALRRKVAEYILASDTASNPTFIGIPDAAAIEASTDLTLDKIDAGTLRKIAISYGGDADIAEGGVLFLNKKDLISFGDIRGTNEKRPVYEITPDAVNPNMGLIRDGGLSVRYCLCPDLPDLGAAAAGKCAMFYGAPGCYEVGLFGDYNVRVSEDYKFQDRMLAVLGEVMIGGNVTVKNGFVRVKKAAAGA